MTTFIFTPLRLNKPFVIKLCFLIFLIACYVTSDAQNPERNRAAAFTVKGGVVDESGKGLPGATVFEKDRRNAATTSADGSFSLNIRGQQAVLVITHVGFHSQEVLVKEGNADIIVHLSTLNNALESVVVVGYGTQKKSATTAAVSTVKGSQLAAVPAANISNTLAGRATGIITRANGGRPGADNATITIRGAATTGVTAPLIVVDGVIRNNINEVDPNNIETVSVLKDAAAVAPFGLGGANGVILITTKRGSIGTPNITFGGYYGDQQPTYLPKMLSAQDYMRLKNEAYTTENPTGTNPPFAQTYIDQYAENNAKDPDKYPISNALNDLVKKHSPIYQSNLQVRGGNESVKYFAGVSYFKQEGMFDRSNYDRFNYNVNFDVNVTPTTTASFSLNGAIQKTSDVDGSTGQLFRGVYKFIPVAPLKFTNGLWGESSGNAPIGVLKSSGYFKQNTNNILSTLAIEQKLPFIPGLSVKGTINYDPYNYVQKQWHLPFTYYIQNTTATPYTYTSAFSTQETSATTYAWLNQQYWQNNTLTLQGYLNYHNTFGKHEFTGLVVAEKRNNKQFDFSGRRNNFAVNIDELSLGSSNKNDFDNSGGSGTGSQVGYVYRASYAFDKKYLFEASGRYDGHYYFAPGKRWTYLPAFSAGWVISNEKFFQSVGFVDFLKIRGSWGKSGNLPTGGAFQFLSSYSLRGNAYSFGDGSLVQGSFVQRENNPAITWEIGKKTDVAIEANFWKGLLRVEADYFRERRTGMLLSPNIVVPQEYGLALAQENAGIMDNHGIELTIGSTKRLENGLQISIDGNFTYAKNKLVQVFENAVTRNDPRRSRTGRRNGTVFGYKSQGLFTTAEDKNGDGFINSTEYPVTQFGNLRPGDIRYADLSGVNGVPDGKIDSYDETEIGNPQTPAIIYGINAAVNWKGLDLSLLFQGSGLSSFNIYGFMTVAHLNNNSNSAYEYYDNRWTPGQQNSKYPRAYSSPSNNNGQTSDFWLISSSYLRLKTASLGYTLPAKVSSSVRMKNLRIYVTGQNIVTFGKLKFTDPETTGEQGYPIQKTFLVGFSTTF